MNVLEAGLARLDEIEKKQPKLIGCLHRENVAARKWHDEKFSFVFGVLYARSQESSSPQSLDALQARVVRVFTTLGADPTERDTLQ